MNLKEDYHVHCNYNDHSAPDLTIKNAIRQANRIGLETLAFTEHVRKNSEWVPKYLRELEFYDNNSTIRIVHGFEAKILEDGSIDCPERYSKDYFLIASFHTKYNSKKIWVNALKKAIENPDVNVIGHIAPECSFALDRTEVDELASLMVKNKKIVELNAKYHRPPNDWVVILKKKGVTLHLGSDAHSLEEIGRYQKISDLILLADSS
ncbi:MAG: PHP domain-containing protein [Thermoproteota archaeon]|nr:PHP domain-containing protein [Thermoproteota archaeon]